jgi:hypothetical protein
MKNITIWINKTFSSTFEASKYRNGSSLPSATIPKIQLHAPFCGVSVMKQIVASIRLPLMTHQSCAGTTIFIPFHLIEGHWQGTGDFDAIFSWVERVLPQVEAALVFRCPECFRSGSSVPPNITLSSRAGLAENVLAVVLFCSVYLGRHRSCIVP